MNKQSNKVSFRSKYLKTILLSINPAFLIGYGVGLWTGTYKLSRIKSGEYPGMPQEQINQQYNDALPTVITESIVWGLVLTLILSIPLLYWRFKTIHAINIFSEVLLYFKREPH